MSNSAIADLNSCSGNFIISTSDHRAALKLGMKKHLLRDAIICKITIFHNTPDVNVQSIVQIVNNLCHK